MLKNKWLIFTILLFYFIGVKHAYGSLIVEKGVLDLRGHDLNELNEVAFKGEWEFYWNQLLTPSDFKKVKTDTIFYIPVPSLWNSIDFNGKKLPAKGAATYRMQVLMSYVPNEMAIKLGGIGTAFKLFVDGKEVSKAGVVSLIEKEAVPGYNPGVLVFTPTNDTIEVIFQVSNYNYSKGGLWLNEYSIGSVDYLINKWNRGIQLSLLLIGSILIFALYHLGLYVLNVNFRYTLYFSLFCLVIVGRILVINEIYLLNIFPDFKWEALVKIDYLSLTLGTLTFSLFIYRFYNDLYSRKFLFFIAMLSSIFSVFIILQHPAVFTKYLLAYQLVVLVASFYVFIVVLKAMKRKNHSALAFLIGFSILLLTVINDILYVNRLISSMFLTSFGFIIFIFSQGYMLSVRFSTLFVSAESMAKRLEKTNQNLEIIVNNRTSEIQEQNTKLREQSKIILQNNSALEKQNDKIKIQRDLLQKHNEIEIKQKKQITSSIEYASKIQDAVMKSESEIEVIAPDSFVLFHPKEIVSGDFYWFKEVSLPSKKIKLIAVVDCTGHGVPGAFMSVLGAMFLNNVVAEFNEDSTASVVLDKLRAEVKKLFGKHTFASSLKDGMNMALCIIDYDTMRIQYAGARNPIYIIRNVNGKRMFEEFKGDNMPIGNFVVQKGSFTNHIIDVNKGDIIYLFSDGYYNQFGGSNGEKLKRNMFKQILIKNSHLLMHKQRLELDKALLEWRGDYDQIDDITVVGIKV